MKFSQWYERRLWGERWLERYPAGKVPEEHQGFMVIRDDWDRDSEPHRHTVYELRLFGVLR